MRAVQSIDFPLLEDLEKYKYTIPGYDEMISIIQAETAKGNIVIHIGDAGCMPQETIVVVDFAYEPKNDYDQIKTHSLSNNREYKYLISGDRKGSLELVFGGWKHRMKKELALNIQMQIEKYHQTQ